MEEFIITDAIRHASPQVLAIAGPMFSGKSLGAIYLGAGLVEPGKKIGVIDTENGKFANWYADDPDVKRAVPQGFKVIELQPPFHPQRFMAANAALERAGCGLIITDNGSHAWDGDGGAQDMKETDRKGWVTPKLWMRRWSNALLYSSVHQIVCLRAQEKTKVTGSGKNQEYTSLGMGAITEKNFFFSLSIAFFVEGMVDNKPATHLATPTKWPKAMNSIFNNWTPQLLTPEIGRKIREWNDAGAKQDIAVIIQKQAAQAAELGMSEYATFYKSLPPAQKKILADSTHEENKRLAENADAKLVMDRLAELEQHERFYAVLGAMGHASVQEIPADKRTEVLKALETELEETAV